MSCAIRRGPPHSQDSRYHGTEALEEEKSRLRALASMDAVRHPRQSLTWQGKDPSKVIGQDWHSKYVSTSTELCALA